MKRVAVGIISRENSDGQDEWLLVSSARNFGQYTGCYYPPGGHLEAGETEQAALTRGIREELGLDAVPIRRIATTKGDVAGQETYWWLCEATGNIRRGLELDDAQYFSRQQIENEINVWPATRKVFEKYVFQD